MQRPKRSEGATKGPKGTVADPGIGSEGVAGGGAKQEAEPPREGAGGGNPSRSARGSGAEPQKPNAFELNSPPPKVHKNCTKIAIL